MGVAGILTNTQGHQVYNTLAVDKKIEDLNDEIEKVNDGLDNGLVDVMSDIDSINDDISELKSKVAHLESLGQLTDPGLFLTKQDMIDNRNLSAFNITPTVGDFCFVKQDEAFDGKRTMYVIQSITNDEVSWGHFDTFEPTDLSGKMDIVQSAVENTLAVFDDGGSVKSAGVTVADILADVSDTIDDKIEALSDTIDNKLENMWVFTPLP